MARPPGRSCHTRMTATYSAAAERRRFSEALLVLLRLARKNPEWTQFRRPRCDDSQTFRIPGRKRLGAFMRHVRRSVANNPLRYLAGEPSIWQLRYRAFGKRQISIRRKFSDLSKIVLSHLLSLIRNREASRRIYGRAAAARRGRMTGCATNAQPNRQISSE